MTTMFVVSTLRMPYASFHTWARWLAAGIVGIVQAGGGIYFRSGGGELGALGGGRGRGNSSKSRQKQCINGTFLSRIFLIFLPFSVGFIGREGDSDFVPFREGATPLRPPLPGPCMALSL